MVEILNYATDSKRIELLKCAPGTKILDTIQNQLAELIEIKFVGNKNKPSVTEYLGGNDAGKYGHWVYYPWSGNFVHLLPKEDFVAVRTNRNKYKLTPREQNELSKKKIGIIGLSVGKSSAITLAMERQFEEIRLADFDVLELSNLNRIVTGVHNLGLKKSEVVAREILEIDPFLKVTCYSEGITSENINDFISSPDKLDLLIDECDSLDIKIKARLEARKLGIPVLMETSDRGMLDVERFDLEPERSIFHGLIEHLDIRTLSDLKTNEDKVPYVLAIVGLPMISNRLKASMLEINQTITTWPQLASDVALGGAIIADTWRRIAIGEFDSSGRFYVDLTEIISKKNKTVFSEKESYNYKKPTCSFSANNDLLDQLEITQLPEQLKLGKNTLEELLSHAIMAPSGGNSQPWKWIYKKNVLFLVADKQRAKSFLDFKFYATYLALGCAVENLKIASNMSGYRIEVAPFPYDDEEIVAAIRFFAGGDEVKKNAISKKYFPYLAARETNRKIKDSEPLTQTQSDALKEVALLTKGASLQIVTDRKKMIGLSNIISGIERMRVLNYLSHSDLMSEIRWSEREVEESCDGIDIKTLELSESDASGIELVKDYEVIDFLKRAGGKGKGLEKMMTKSINASSALCFIKMPNHDRLDFFNGGKALQRVWLEATRLGLAIQPVAPSVFLFARLKENQLSELDEQSRKELVGYRKEFMEIMELRDDSVGEVFLFRIFRAESASHKSLRRPVQEVFQYNV